MRYSWSNTLSYILITAGATIGFGATWRFPYLVGENGGGAYVLTFVVAMIIIGIPMILVENIIGRRAHKNALDAFDPKYQGKTFSKAWKIVGFMGLIGCFGIIAYYMVLGGWVLTYISNILSGNLNLSGNVTKEITQQFYNINIEHNPLMITFYTLIFILLNYVVLIRGISDGIEKAMKFLMPLLFLCLIVVVIRNLTLEGASVGINFYLKPDFSKITPTLFIAVLGQVFFALSLGFAVMITLSSFLNKNENMVKTAIATSVINTLIALLAGFMIFPSLFAFGLEPNSGPKLVFEVLPIVFSKMHFGSFFAVSFFTLLLIAAFTTLQEKLNMSRKKAVFWILFLSFILGNLPSIMAYGPLSEVSILGKNIFDAFDFISGNVFFVLTALGASIFVAWVLKEDAKEELARGFNNKMVINLWFYYVKFIIPIIIVLIFISRIF
ncbi:sodium-dependent transporter [Campylobacter hepaticus]|uniref:sodium-dependent transporter n=1 Tax=Campylobacter hepaticus TaxID=1813019 RepID=UPI0029A596AF|nr:sodium-dependent transporter [Campylobacter hepaticus]MDX2330863.1 sodium-dependent transporter [Campylobacter hepaticus]MDX2371531.1 sodium-dependent transporter [Campylobacter hepaticus]MDX2396781.1 sodium-dependent transporter [Campylobacter hepaticus]MDX5508689.1 sodium-dependent transporter [Campylobacter hepaticus]